MDFVDQLQVAIQRAGGGSDTGDDESDRIVGGQPAR